MSALLIVVTNAGLVDGTPTTGLWFSEFSEPYEVLVAAGIDLKVASPRGGPTPIDPRGYPRADEIAHVRDALEVLNATAPLSGITHDTFDGIFMPGGHGPMFDLAIHPGLKALIAEFWTAGKAVASVCHGPASLLDVVLPGGTTLLRGRRVTGFSHAEDQQDALFSHMPFSLQDRMTLEGANFQEGPAHQPHVEVDGRLVTGQNPQSGRATAEALITVLKKERRSS
ncbi:type 1 glutamine amidotransferase domain-containing protein [Mycobacterium sp.]|uniref:type 1 glutamine amidotransferase domain-containing protein n=1 Tax=Mycobacterium sp. TaxID=1785 RepID=UPI003D1199A3